MGQETCEYTFDCPCGRGVVTNRVTSYDNGYSRDLHAVSVECESCARNYIFKQVFQFERGTIMTATNTATRESRELVLRDVP